MLTSLSTCWTGEDTSTTDSVDLMSELINNGVLQVAMSLHYDWVTSKTERQESFAVHQH